MLPNAAINPAPEDIGVIGSPLTTFPSGNHQQFGTMTVRMGSTLAMDPEGISVSVSHAREHLDYVSRFTAQNVGTAVYRSRSDRFDSTEREWFRGTTPLVEVARHVDEWAMVARGGFEKISIEIPQWCRLTDFAPAYDIVKCPELVIRTEDEETMIQWLQRIDDGPQFISIKPGVDTMKRRIQPPAQLSRQFAELPIWRRRLDELVLMHWVPFTDEEFLSIRCKWFDILTPSVSDEALNTYLHMWVSGGLPGAERFGISVDRPFNINTVTRGLRVAEWGAMFRKTFPQLQEQVRDGETRFTVFRTVKEDETGPERECSNGTLIFDAEQGVYFEVRDYNRELEQQLTESLGPRAVIID